MNTTNGRRRKRTALAMAGPLMIAVLGACGEPASQAQATSLQDALGLDENAFEAREAKVQDAIRTCMTKEGFEYVPVDPSQMNIQIREPGGDDNPKFRRTKGYGITTTFGDRPEPAEGSSDPNEKIRAALSEADQKAYDRALFGKAAEGGGVGDISVRIGPGVAGAGEEAPAPNLAEAGCFGRAQQQAEDGNDKLKRIGPDLQEMQERIDSDPRMVKANTAWAACMSKAGFDFEDPDDIPPYLFAKLQELQGDGEGDGGGKGSGVRIAPPVASSPELTALQQEELAMAKADDGCSEKTGRRATTKKVRAEAERRFLQDNPDLGIGGAGDGQG